jgi:hypothetical protein
MGNMTNNAHHKRKKKIELWEGFPQLEVTLEKSAQVSFILFCFDGPTSEEPFHSVR